MPADVTLRNVTDFSSKVPMVFGRGGEVVGRAPDLEARDELGCRVQAELFALVVDANAEDERQALGPEQLAIAKTGRRIREVVDESLAILRHPVHLVIVALRDWHAEPESMGRSVRGLSATQYSPINSGVPSACEEASAAVELPLLCRGLGMRSPEGELRAHVVVDTGYEREARARCW